jgi:hypothetical protein
MSLRPPGLVERRVALTLEAPPEIPIGLTVPYQAKSFHFFLLSMYAGTLIMAGRSRSAISSTVR